MKAVDVMGFAGGMAAGVDQAGFDVIAKREPAKFGGFGVASHVYNMPWLDAQVAPFDEWDLPPEPDIDLVFGCPPCSGFSGLSFANKQIHGTIVGEGAQINECMRWLIDYAARVKPRVVILESVGLAFKNGRGWMEGLHEELVQKSGVDYFLTHVNMNAAWVGGNVKRPRYFFVAHQDPFGVGLEFVEPKTAGEVLADLPEALEPGDADWGHDIYHANGPDRMIKTMKWLREVHGRKWKPGTRLPQNVEGLSPPDFWLRPDGKSSPRNPNPETPVYSHWFSTDPFSTFRWYPDKPFGVVVAAVLDRAIHPVHDRTLTFREAARFMSIPDDWSLRKLVEANKGAELGKAVPSASAKWIAHWARMSIEGTPGEYAGVADTGDDIIRVINVQRKPDIEAILASPPPNSLWSEPTADPDPATWLIDQRSRPAKWPQREFDPVEVRTSPDKEDALKPAKTRRQTGPRRARTPSGTGATGSGIVRIEPERVAQVIAQAGLDKKAAAERLGVSVSRVNELTSHARPGSWLNAERWDDVQEKLRG
jgi:site-specific DNA-cytosine methylase